ncbi:MAG: hypothetical protein LBE01_04270, partial [Deltaproteobacteria bacterium]|nr:hypothetical protein [Deltaproteobacteria bacterium]
MKLATKIIIGFVCTCVSFTAISVAVMFSLRSVLGETADLRDEIMPANDLAGDLISNTARAGLNILDYSFTGEQSAYDKFSDFDSKALAAIDKLKTLIRQGLAENETEVRDLVGLNEKDYLAFEAQAKKLPPVMSTIFTDRTATLNAFKALSEAVRKYREQRLSQILDMANSTAAVDVQEFRRVSDHLTRAINIKDEADEFYVNFLRGLYYQDASYFQTALEFIAKMISDANAIMADSKISESQGLINSVLDAAKTSQAAVSDLHKTMLAFLEDKQIRMNVRTQAIDTASNLSAAMTGLANKFVEVSNASLNASFWTIVVGGLIALAISAVLSVFITRNITVPINQVIATLADGAQEVDGASGELSSASNTLAEGATENAASLEETSAALEELSSMTKRNSDNAVEANSLMSSATEAVVKAENSMTNVIQAMDHIATSGN